MKKLMPSFAATPTATRLPQIPVDIDKPSNCLSPIDSPDNFNLRIMQRNNRTRRTIGYTMERETR